ncbi:phage terminase small subunit P27 family [Agrobacterium vitis]|uniref:Phage terminase small subunit P27 family n=1 Tax=Agrobacterium vitis TaxID=373 RepID=A0AAE4WG27_AGRVI|nr:phage terminase small subunit P27 family [Agrobacterium vitis]MCF1499638.1 phage terminase small subunit P27 family [Allorhizobium sp. Av2]MCM2440706.1 phage terminase small subunit P27 family [Agrobacterium vitis]MUZ59315.1 phage terminase small subunit P27 family [Agrobacterium vitis]MVA66546.1 phage terminase small subunit P27 family [Agrobacterium vitis]MVA87407.1 phage terminase small subunit P27 family [Agrobacterium vitis]
MSTRGRKADLRVIEGGGMEQVPDGVPSHIPDEMRSEWLAVANDLKQRRMLTEAMFGSVDAYVMAMFNVRKAQEAIDKHGLLIDSGKGILKQNPAVSLLGKAQSAILRLSAELGLTPASRSRSKMKGGGDGDVPGQKDMFDDVMDF